MFSNKYNFSFLEENNNELFSYWNDILKEIKNDHSFSLLLPPPNITGNLHLGHALNSIIQDFIVRYFRLNKKNYYWISGIDHAGISLQNKIEEMNFFKKAGISDEEKRISILEDWYPKSLEIFYNQWNKLGLLIDYKNSNFTLDESVQLWVRKCFISLYNDGMIYFGSRIINWDSKLKTFLSDIETEIKVSDSNLYYLKYFFSEKRPNDLVEYLLVATSRPETIFSDVALFVNPLDKRYSNFIGRTVKNIWNNKNIPILSDDSVKINFATGILKCTPGHSFIDYELAKKHGLEIFSSCKKNSILGKIAGKWEGREIFSIKDEIVSYLKENNFCEKIENYKSSIIYSKKSGSIVEPILSKQWFIDIKLLLKKIDFDNNISNILKKIDFFPDKFRSLLENWKEKARDWCISRQLWWGHKIPAWHNKINGKIYVGEYIPNNFSKEEWVPENDVLDTWFSSSLWPLISLSNINNKNYETFPNIIENAYPLDILVTAYDIIFFWVFKMIILCYYFTKIIPFKKIIFHGIIRDKNGKKMSKSLGNGIDPINIIKKYGSDSLRIFILKNNIFGSDLSFQEDKIIECWRFCQKIWSVANFLFIKNLKTELFGKSIKKKTIFPFIYKFESKLKLDEINYFEFLLNKWILIKLTKIQNYFLTNFKKNDNWEINHFIEKIIFFLKEDFSNTYLELLKKIDVLSDFANKTSLFVYQQFLLIFHPSAPFITDYIYNKFTKKKILIDCDLEIISELSEEKVPEIDLLVGLVDALRLIQKKIKKNENIYLEFNNKNLNYLYNDHFNIFSFLSKIIEIPIFCWEKNNLNSSFYILEGFGIIWYTEKDNNLNSKKFVNLEEKLSYYVSEHKRSKLNIDNQSFIKNAPLYLLEKEREKEFYYRREIKKIKDELTTKKEKNF